MSATGLDVFDKTLHETNRWLKVVMETLKTDNRRHAFAALRATLQVLRDRIGPNNAVHLGAQLPMLLRGAYYEGWHPAGTPTRERHVENFIAHVASKLPRDLQLDAEHAARASLAALAECVDPGEVAKVAELLPLEIRGLWPRGLVEQSGSSH